MNDTSIIYDDPSKQAQAYHQMPLLLQNLPSRKAYLGDASDRLEKEYNAC